jgi:hypothetical protein
MKMKSRGAMFSASVNSVSRLEANLRSFSEFL